MQLTKRGKTYILIAALSAFFAYLITSFNNFPFFGLSLSLAMFTVVSYKLKKNKTSETRKYFTITLALALFISIRSEGFITFLNFLSTLFFGSLMLTASEKSKLGFIEHALNPVILVLRSLFEKSAYYLEYENDQKEKGKAKTLETTGGVVISLVILAVIIPLLSSSNPIFERTVNNVLNSLNLTELFKDFSYETLFIWAIRLVFFFGFLFVMPKILTYMNANLKEIDFLKWKEKSLALLIPKIATSVILLIFIITQVQYYLASPETLGSLGVTLSERSREVFAQLSIVAVIIFALIYNDRKKEGMEKTLTYILFAESAFLIFAAYKSVFDYIGMWGFTHKRLWGVTVATYILTVFSLYFRTYVGRKSAEDFARKGVTAFGLFLIAVNLANFDYLIYHLKKSATGQGVDHFYLSRLSPDSLSYDKQLKEVEAVYNSTPNKSDLSNKISPWPLLRNIEMLQIKYKKLDYRGFNLHEYLSYQKIKDVDLQKYYSMYGQVYYPPAR